MAGTRCGLGRAGMAALVAASLLPPPAPAHAQAQSLADARCADAVKLEPEDQRMLVVWLSGCFAGAGNTPMIDPAAIRNARQALAELCTKTPDARLLSAEARAAILGIPAGR